MSSIVDHWRKLSTGVHPLDFPVFEKNKHNHKFNLDFPPPAYIGDVDNAPVILLDANGGYDEKVTPTEFSSEGAIQRYIDHLHHPRRVDPSSIAPYYGLRNYSKLIRDGRLALVNAVAYRSKSISQEPENRKLANELPSTDIHRKWLRSELLVQASRGERLVIAHRTRLWKLHESEQTEQTEQTEQKLRGVIFTTNPVSANLSKFVLERIDDWSSSDHPSELGDLQP